MVGTAGKENGQSAFCGIVILGNLLASKYLLVFLLNIPAVFLLCKNCLLQGGFRLFLCYTEGLEVVYDLLFQQLRISKVDDGSIERFLQVDNTLDDITVTRHHGAVETVQCVVRVVIVLIHHIGHKDAVNLLVFVQFLQMTMGQLGREADVVAHHRVQGILVLGEGRVGGEYHVKARFTQQGVPEGILFIHIEDAWDTYYNMFVGSSAVSCLCRAFEEHLVLACIYVLALYVILALVVEHPFALVARKKSVATRKGIARHETAVFAAMTLQLLRFVVG